MKSRFLVLGLALSFTFPVLAQAETSSVGDAGKAWEIPNDADRGQHIFVLNGTSFGNEVNRGSFLIQSDFVSGQMTDPTCAEFVESKCSTTNFQNRAVLKQCLEANSINCLADFGVID